jgi:hypothetical protein
VELARGLPVVYAKQDPLPTFRSGTSANLRHIEAMLPWNLTSRNSSASRQRPRPSTRPTRKLSRARHHSVRCGPDLHADNGRAGRGGHQAGDGAIWRPRPRLRRQMSLASGPALVAQHARRDCRQAQHGDQHGPCRSQDEGAPCRPWWHCASRLARRSTLMLAARITLPHFSVSSAMCLPKSNGDFDHSNRFLRGW